MKRALLLLYALVLTLAAAAQKEEDFASRYMALFGDKRCLTCKTISPKMMERIMRLDTVDGDATARAVIAQLRGIRILTAEDDDNARQLFEEAEELARRNRRRYVLHSRCDNQVVYVRRRGRMLVELVALRLKDNRHFSLLDFTGNMSENIIEQILDI